MLIPCIFEELYHSTTIFSHEMVFNQVLACIIISTPCGAFKFDLISARRDILGSSLSYASRNLFDGLHPVSFVFGEEVPYFLCSRGEVMIFMIRETDLCHYVPRWESLGESCRPIICCSSRDTIPWNFLCSTHISHDLTSCILSLARGNHVPYDGKPIFIASFGYQSDRASWW